MVGLISPTFLRRSEFKLSTIFYIMVLCYYKNTYTYDVSIKGRIFISVSFTRSRRGTSWILLKYKICWTIDGYIGNGPKNGKKPQWISFLKQHSLTKLTVDFFFSDSSLLLMSHQKSLLFVFHLIKRLHYIMPIRFWIAIFQERKDSKNMKRGFVRKISWDYYQYTTSGSKVQNISQNSKFSLDM